MPSIIRNIAEGQLVAFRFMQDNLAASQTDVQLTVAEVAAAAGNAVDGVTAPWAGEIVGVAYDLSAAGSAGNLSVGASINGTENANTTQAITTAVTGYGRVPRGQARFVAGDIIGAEITTDGSWNGTTADLVVTVFCLVYLDGI